MFELVGPRLGGGVVRVVVGASLWNAGLLAVLVEIRRDPVLEANRLRHS